MLEKTSLHLLLGAQDQRLVADHDRHLLGPQESLLATIKRLQLVWFGHVTRHDSLSKTILQGTLDSG